MNNALLTILTTYGLKLMSNQLKNNVRKYILIGCNNVNDTELTSILDQNEQDNSLTYETLANKNWIGYEGNIQQVYYDKDNFLTFELTIPYDEELNIYVYAIGLIEYTEKGNKLISISKSPMVFNKVKYVTSFFSIKITLGQEELNNQVRDNIYESSFIQKEYAFLADKADINILQSDEILRNISIGTQISGKGIPDNTVVVANSSTDNHLTQHQIRLSNNITEEIQDEPIFVVKTIYKQDDYVTKAEFDSWQKNHNHNTLYYRVNERVKDSSRLNGLDASSYITASEFNELKKDVNNKINSTGGTIQGSLLSSLNNNTPFRDNEFVPLVYIKKLIQELKSEVDDFNTIGIEDKFLEIVGNLNAIQLNSKTNIVNAINELKKLLGNTTTLKDQNPTVVGSINNTIDKLDAAIEKINKLEDSKLGNDNVEFKTTPKSIEEVDITANNLDETLLTNIGTVKKFISTVRRQYTIDLSKETSTMCFPIVLNDAGIDHYTDSIIWNTTNIALPGAVRLYVSGNGASGNNSGSVLSATSLHVSNNCSGTNKFIKRIETFSDSAAIIVYVRGGISYKIEMRGSDKDYQLITNANGVRLVDSANIVKPEAWDNNKYLDNGLWDFNGDVTINLDYTYNLYTNKNESSKVGQIAYFPTSNIKPPFIPAVGQMLSKTVDAKLFAVIGNLGDPEGIYNTETEFKNIDLRDLTIMGASQGNLIPAQTFIASTTQASNIITAKGDTSTIAVGAILIGNDISSQSKIIKKEGNQLTLDKPAISTNPNVILTQEYVPLSYQHNLYLANETLEDSMKSRQFGLISMYPAIRNM